jgi:LAO/AO transport system kinase
MSLLDRILAGDRLALARLLTQIENEQPEGFEALSGLFSRTGQAHLVGITGAGHRQSTLVNRLAPSPVQDPGDGSHRRRRLSSLLTRAISATVSAQDQRGHIFIRSMDSRGALGGLAHDRRRGGRSMRPGTAGS